APTDPARYRAREQAADLVALLDALAIPRCVVLGYSMGGRLALHLALAAQDRLTALVLESASPGIADAAERAERQRTDEALARAIEERGTSWFADHWEALPLFASRRALPDAQRIRLREAWTTQRPHGLAAALRGFGAGTMPPLWDRLGELRLPVLLVVGALDAKYVAIGQAMAERIPESRLAIVPEAGHTVHLERPAAWLALLDALFEH
ncbi:MAG: alpha/beta fold hydrolase, partial [Thermomicrobium sp.]|nr:alpha/beta fold hydrolase [Thermomicrobium sp.]